MCATLIDKVIYAIGGFNGFEAVDDVEKYDFGTNQWTIVSPLNHKRCKAGIANDRS